MTPTPPPRHILAQQILAAALAGHGFELATWRDRWGSLPLFDGSADRVLRRLIEHEFLGVGGGLAFVGPQTEKHYGRRHFMELLAVFAAPPQFRVLAGRRGIGSVGVEVLLDDTRGTRLILLAGRSWQVNHIDWRRRQCSVEQVAGGGKARWVTVAGGLSYEIADGCRSVVLGELPVGVTLSRRATDAVIGLRADLGAVAAPDGPMLERTLGGDWRWWTWAGMRVNRTLAAWLPNLIDPTQRVGDLWLRLHPDLSAGDINGALADARAATGARPLPAVDPDALRGLKFADALPEDLAVDTAARRMVDAANAERVLRGTSASARLVR